jgi:anti-sigma factor RsiW
MTHPEELLAGYVDGTLSAKEQAAVDTHVAECPRCSREVMLAAGARSALGSLVEVPAPPGIASKALEEAGAVRRSAGGGTPRWYRVGGIVAAAAAGLLVLTLVLPHIGQSEDSGSVASQGKEGSSARDAGSQAAALAAPPVIEIRHVNYDNASLTGLTASYQSDTSGGGAASGVQAPVASEFGSQAQTDKALACVVKSAPDQPGELQSLIRARFQGTPAYLAVFLEGPGAGQPADAVTVWVFATTDCRILSFSSAQL